MTTTQSSSRQSGSLVTFILVGVALVALLAGGVYLAKQRGILASNQEAGTSDLATTPDESEPAKEQDEEKKTDQQQDRSSDQQGSDGQANQQDQESGRETGNVASNSTDNDNSSSTATPPASEQPQASVPAQTATPTPAVAPRTGGQSVDQPTEAIPATGFEDQIIVSAFGMTALVYGSFRYIQSRRRLSRL